MIYYPLSVKMLAGIREVFIIPTPEDLPRLDQLLDDRSDIDMKFEYFEQLAPDALAKVFI